MQVSGAVAKKTVRRSSLPSTSSAVSSSVAKRVNANGDPKITGGAGGVKRQLPAAMQALKKKYADQRLAKKVVSKALPPPQRATRSTAATEKKQQKKGRDAEKRSAAAATEQQRQAHHTRSTRSNQQQQRGRRRIKSPVGGLNLTLGRKPPSAATLVAKRKTRMATLTAASSSVSRMLTRLTPRGTSSAAFVRSTKKINLERRSLRGREISVSSDEEESEDEEVSLKVSSSAKAGGKASPPKRKLKSREEKDKLQKKSHRPRPYSESEADEETSSRDSSRKPPPLHHRHRQQLPLSKSSSSKLNLDPRVVLNKRDVRSLSRDSSGSGSTTNSSSRPSRKTKEAASVYLNVLGHKLLKKRSEHDEDDEDEDDNISIDSLNESTQEKRLEALKAKKKASAKAGKARKAADEDASGTTDSEKGGDRKKGSKEKKKLKSSACSLKQLQDKLLEEAKMKIGTPPPAPAPVLKTKSTEQGRRFFSAALTFCYLLHLLSNACALSSCA